MRRACLLLTLVLGACKNGPVDVDVDIFDAGEPGTDAAAPDAAEYLDLGFNLNPDAQEDATVPGDSGPDAAQDPDALPGDADPTADADLADVDPGDNGAPDPDGGAPEPDAGAPEPDGGAPDPDGGQPLPDGGAGDTGVVINLSWVEHVIDSTLAAVSSVQAVDIDGDQDLDVLAASFGTGEVRLYLNGGTGVFTPVPVATGVYAVQTAVADLDLDGDLDVAIAGLYDPALPFGSAGEVRWAENPGSPAQAWVPHPITGFTFYGPRSIAAGDLTGDGRPDLVVGCIEAYDAMGNARGQGLYWLRNAAAGFTGPTAIDLNLGQVEVTQLSDVDLDGVLDVVVSSTGNGEVLWYENDRVAGVVNDSPLFSQHSLVVHNRAYGLAQAQLDPDPSFELFASYDNGAQGALITLDSPANPADPWVEVEIDPSFGGGDPLGLASADLDGNGEPDLAVASSRDAMLAAYYKNGAGYSRQLIAPLLPGLSAIAAGDVDGDQRPDLVTCTNTTVGGDTVSWWENLP